MAGSLARRIRCGRHRDPSFRQQSIWYCLDCSRMHVHSFVRFYLGTHMLGCDRRKVSFKQVRLVWTAADCSVMLKASPFGPVHDKLPWLLQLIGSATVSL